MHNLIIMTKIFESPDKGETVYIREAGALERTLYLESELKQTLHEQIQENQLWDNIRRRAKTHPGLQDELNRVIMFYQLMNERHGR